jgi:NACHT domain
MPLIETLTTSVGLSIAKALLRLWLRDDALALDLGLTLTDLADRGGKTFKERRALKRGFERVAEEVAEKLEAYLESEFSGVQENEIEAAIFAAQGTIDSAKLDLSQILSADLEPLRLEAILRQEDPDAASHSLLSDDGTAVYDFTLREASNYIVEVASTLPNFEVKRSRELLERDTLLIELVREVLDQLPAASATGGLGSPERFEDQYRRDVVRKLDQLELFGVSTSALNRRYALSIAYIGLTASSRDPSSDSKAGRSSAKQKLDKPKADSEDGRVEMGVEQLVARSRRSLIRGEAGSGKTTLLQWLAVTSARQRFRGDLDEWNDTVPFLVRLRSHVGEELPQPKDFPLAINPTLAELMPEGWVGRQMEDGRALLLIDGVDELREEEREKAAEWLRDLLTTYPDARYVVTSRPPAVEEGWLGDEGFSSAFLEPMDVPAIDAFIDHWHRAAAGNVEGDEADELTTFSARLRGLVREAPQIRNLATSPLLCAMLCALTRDRKAQLPRDRVELYRIGLEMLLERRDQAREVTTDDVNLSRPRKELLLQGFAFWLLNNGLSDATRGDVENLFAEKVQSMPRVSASADEVLQHLLLRSGVLREPVVGRIDFIHRTFLEYLAAKQAVEERSIGLLVDHSHQDQWQGVVVLAAGLGTESVSQELLESLLNRAAREPQNQHRLQLLAVASLETTPVLPRELQDEIASVLEGLIPPKSMSEAKQIASAGDIAAPLLGRHAHGNVATAAPSARSLGLIGGDDALAQLEKFGPDDRVTVARELIRSWDYFPIEEYARRVLVNSVLERGSLAIESPEKLNAIRQLRRLRHLKCYALGRSDAEWEWAVLGETRGLSSLEIRYHRGYLELPRGGATGWTAELDRLHLSGCVGLISLSLAGFDALVDLSISSCSNLQEIMGLEALPNLETIWLGGLDNFIPSGRLPSSVKDVGFGEVEFRNLDLLLGTSLTELMVVNCPALSDAAALTEMSDLQMLEVIECEELEDFSAILANSAVRRFELSKTPHFDLDAIGHAAQLEELTVERDDLRELGPIGELAGLRRLDLTGCTNAGADLGPLGELAELRSLSLAGSREVSDLSPLAGLANLRRLDLEMCQGIETIDPLLGLESLEWVDLRGCSPDLDPRPLKEKGVRVLVAPTERRHFAWAHMGKRRVRVVSIQDDMIASTVIPPSASP